MPSTLAFAVALLKRWGAVALIALPALTGAADTAGESAKAEPVLVIDKALSVQAIAALGAVTQLALQVTLPDDWAVSRPRFEGSVWYRTGFDRPAGIDSHELMAMYVARVCSNFEVYLNGERLFSGGRMSEPVTRNCRYPQLIPLPTALLKERGNKLDLQVQGHALPRVASRQRAGGISVIKIGPQALLAAEHEWQTFWNVTSIQIANLAITVLGVVMIGMVWLNRQEAYLGYFGWLCVVWALLSARSWWREMPWDNGVMEFLFCTGFAPLVALAVQFLLSYAGVRSRWIENALAVQWVLLPATLLLAGPGHLFALTNVWYAVLGTEILAASVLHLIVSKRSHRGDTVWMAALLLAVAALLAVTFVAQQGLIGDPGFSPLQLVLPLLLAGMGARLMQVFARTLKVTGEVDESLERRVQDATAEAERNYAHLAELRVEQVIEKERKRIAADLHDDLGAKLLTIVHTSDSERISTLAREALEEMRLSVRGLTGKPMRLADALADWRAETVLRLGQANIEADWRGPTEEIEQLLPARGFVQTTRILREAVSNIIKHSGASHCKVRCAITNQQFGLTVQDNGKGIPMELDGKLDRGHGMSSMKHRAKQMQGQCLVESGPGYGTVIRLTLPL